MYIISMCNNNASIGLSIQSFLRIPMRKNITSASVPPPKKTELKWKHLLKSTYVTLCYTAVNPASNAKKKRKRK